MSNLRDFRGSSLGPSMVLRAASAAAFFALGLAVACGGSQLAGGPGSGSAGSGGSGGGGSGGSGGSMSAPDGATCVDINLSSYDQSCNHDSDCVAVAGGGQFCDGYCDCDMATINQSAVAGYTSALSAVTQGPVCACPESGNPTCVDHVCQLCLDIGGGSTCRRDEAGADGGACVTFELSTAQTCKKDSDCGLVGTGLLCNGSCGCGTTPANQEGVSAYNAATSQITFAGCPCAVAGEPTCVEGTCALCLPGGGTPGCPDGG